MSKKLIKLFDYFKNFIFPNTNLGIHNAKIIFLGKQYLNDKDFNELIKGINEENTVFIGSGNEVKNLNSFDPAFRKQIKFPFSISAIEKSIEDSILSFLPTIFLENYLKYKDQAQKLLPKNSPVILNSMNHGSGYFVDFLIN